MTTKFSPFLLIIILLGLGSCVSKKKFLEMESYKLRAENRVRELTEENNNQDKRIKTMVADFEQMKGELLESNAIKNQLIDSLSGKVNVLSSDVSAKDASIEEKIYAFEYEKRRLIEDAAQARQKLANREEEFQSLGNQFTELKNELSRINFDLTREKDQSQGLQSQLQLKEEKIAANQQETDALKNEIKSLKNQLNEKNKAIEKLENNVKLLKSQLK